MLTPHDKVVSEVTMHILISLICVLYQNWNSLIVQTIWHATPDGRVNITKISYWPLEKLKILNNI